MTSTSKRFIVIAIVVAAALGAVVVVTRDGGPVDNNQSQGTTETTTTTSPTKDTFNKQRYSTTDPASLWIVVNKQQPLQPATYTPADLRYPNVSLRIPGAPEMQMRAEPAGALETMFGAAAKDGIKLQVTTAYRGYAYQKSLYDGYVTSEGQQKADEQSARPGYSEHQTGLAVDIRPQSGECYLEPCFGETPEGRWLAANAYRYGFMIRYPNDKQTVTGYHYEPWHVRYVGKQLSNELHTRHIETLEEFFDISGGETYR